MARLPLAIASIPLLASLATAQWSENFDSYAVNSQVVNQGGWEEWGPGAGAFVSNVQSRSPGNSIAIAGPSDLVHQYLGYTTGKWVYRTWQYIPSTMTGATYFILLSEYAYPAGPYNWNVQVEFSIANGVKGNFGRGVIGHNTVPLVTNAWVEIKVLIDLDQDWTQFYYDGVLLDEPLVLDHPTLGGGYQWSRGVFGGNTNVNWMNIAAVDLYANNATAVYYDDMSLHAAQFEVFGTGCGGAMPAPSFTLVLPPVSGQPYLHQINNLPLNACIHAFGFGNQTSLLGPLPLHLTAYGAPNCYLRINPESTIFLMGTQNSASFVLNLPPGLQGLKFYVQAAGLDPTANSLGLTVSPMAAVWVQ
ncbi:MAG: hypothetical protein FJ265_16425 [Planctomycetes bacterium]|nr:hypothetical protein [Planctomycetota bacterium]